jgi:prepilin-type N-terminal cleavage/methylation domain-containing protein
MQEKGFTLVELLIVLALIAILVSILVVIINPGQIMMRGRDTQRIGDLRNLAAATDAYISDIGTGANLPWPTRGSCSSTSPGYNFYSTPTVSTLTGWPNPSNPTGTLSVAVDGTGWVPLNFKGSNLLNLSSLPLDPRNGQQGTAANGQTVVFAYAFSCDTNFGYEYAAKLEGNAQAMVNDGGNRNNCTTVSPDCLYEVGSNKSLY